MGSDAISNAHLCTFPKVSSNNKRGNKMGKLRYNKLYFQGEQCLIQVSNKKYAMETNDIVGGANCPSAPKRIEGRQNSGNLPGHNIIGNDFYRHRSRNSSSGSCSSSCSDEDTGKGYLDNWGAISDALNIENKPDTRSQSVFKRQAWSPDDVFRPRSLPRISRQQNNVMHFSVNDADSSACPICCEDLDVTDSRFLPCPCGFRLCLFCHKKIIEVDGRCPGCRKKYSSENASAGNPGSSLVLPIR